MQRSSLGAPAFSSPNTAAPDLCAPKAVRVTGNLGCAFLTNGLNCFDPSSVMGRWPQSGLGPLSGDLLHPTEGNGVCLQLETSQGLELGQGRSAVQYDAGTYGLDVDGAHGLGRVLVAIDRLFNLGPRPPVHCPMTVHTPFNHPTLYMFCYWQAELAQVARELHIQTVKS